MTETIHSLGAFSGDIISCHKLIVNLFIFLFYVLTGIKNAIDHIQLQKNLIPGGQTGSFF
jgi:hypothetical protein